MQIEDNGFCCKFALSRTLLTGLWLCTRSCKFFSWNRNDQLSGGENNCCEKQGRKAISGAADKSAQTRLPSQIRCNGSRPRQKCNVCRFFCCQREKWREMFVGSEPALSWLSASGSDSRLLLLLLFCFRSPLQLRVCWLPHPNDSATFRGNPMHQPINPQLVIINALNCNFILAMSAILCQCIMLLNLNSGQFQNSNKHQWKTR